MLANQAIQKLIHDIKNITGLDCSVWTGKKECLAMTNQNMRPDTASVAEFLEENSRSGRTEDVSGEKGLFLAEETEDKYVLVIAGTDEKAVMAGRFGVSHLTSLMQADHSRMDKNRFIQNLILDNLLLVDIYNQARKMKISIQQKRVVFLVESKGEGDNLVMETLKGLFAAGMRDFVTSVDEKHVILVKELETTDGYQEIQRMAEAMADTLNMEAMVGVRVSYGTIVEELKDVSRSYKEADMAMEIGRVFYEEKRVLAYKVLGIGRLIHQLPKSLCEMFLEEVYEGNAVASFEDEELAAVYTFFDNNLNISETARTLYVHRNTLVYRLEKIQKKTGLDVRVFEDAMMFKIAMMVEKHISGK